MDDPQLNNENGFNPSGGRGRGRGRGVPLLPQGLWDELNKRDSNEISSSDYESKNFEHNSEEKAFEIPKSFGRGTSGRGMGQGRSGGRGLNRDMKGTDWDCPSCMNVNWSWRVTCNKCGGGRPITIVIEGEVRDGVGGGFNERQDRVSAASVEVDEDGFDDFGRRVKKGFKDIRAKELAALARLKENYGFLLPGADKGLDHDESDDITKNDTDKGYKDIVQSLSSRAKDYGHEYSSEHKVESKVVKKREQESVAKDQINRRSDNRDRDRDRDRDRSRDKDRDYNRNRDRSRDRDRNRSRDRDRDRDRSRDRYKQRGHGRHR